MRKRGWDERQLRRAVHYSTSIRQVLGHLGLAEAGGNYYLIGREIRALSIPIDHFTGRGWSKGKQFPFAPKYALEDILVRGSSYQSYKLKKRLFSANLKQKRCEMCGWAKYTKDGHLPLELDHINGDHTDNRLSNLRILCPNCHSLTPTHRSRKRSQ